MEIIIAKRAGFCFGVKRAVDRVYQEADKGKIYTYGPIIHNKEVTNELKEKGVKIIDTMEESADGKIILRSHGVSPRIYAELDDKKLEYIDCTCPYVKKIHEIVERESKKGNRIIIIGNKNHPEIIGINGWADNNALIFDSEKDIKEFMFDDLESNYSIVVQTTFQQEILENILKILTDRHIKYYLFNTICHATVERQKEADEISRIVDHMIVIGDKNSSNSGKLFEICKKNCKHTHFIETIRNLQLNIFASSDKIGITAGASTSPATIKEAIKLMSDLEKGTDQSFEEMLNETFVTLHTGDIVKGTIIQISNGEISVNLGYKSDGIIQKGEYIDDPDTDLNEIAKVGDEIEVFVIRVNDGEGNVLLSKRRVDSQKGMEDIESAVEAGTVFKGKIIEVVKGGLIAIINGIRAFVPSSQISNRFVEDMNVFKGQELDFNILEVDKTKRRVIAGRKELAKKQLAEKKEKIFSSIEVGQKIDGVVSRIVDFGAFVDIGGIDGLIHISELSWGRIKKVTDVLKEGDKVSVNIIEIKRDKEKISLSLRDSDKNPWASAAEKYAVGSILGGKVVRILPFGAFVELEEGVDGLVHISQISTKRIEKPEDELSIGQIITVKVTELDLDNKKISLSKKAAETVEESPAANDMTEAVEESPVANGTEAVEESPAANNEAETVESEPVKQDDEAEAVVEETEAEKPEPVKDDIQSVEENTEIASDEK